MSESIPMERIGEGTARLLEGLHRKNKKLVFEKLKDLPRRMQVRANEWYPRTGLRVRNTAGLAQSTQGFLRNLGGGKVTVGLKNPMVYAAAHEYGTPPYEITPGAKGFLAWKGKDGNWIYTKKPVQHPGLKARHFLSIPVKEEGKKLVRELQKEIGF